MAGKLSLWNTLAEGYHPTKCSESLGANVGRDELGTTAAAATGAQVVWKLCGNLDPDLQMSE
jgi:hypothetical protein